MLPYKRFLNEEQLLYFAQTTHVLPSTQETTSNGVKYKYESYESL